MSRRLPLFATLALLTLLGVRSAAAESQVFNIDPSHSQVGFNVRHFFGKVPGFFKDYSGTITYDPASLVTSSVDVTIKTASIDTRNDRRDNHLKSADFFYADSFPTITFKSKKVIPGADKDHFKIVGDLTMRGVTKEVTLDASFLGMGSTGLAGGGSMGVRAGWEANTVVNRKEYGILWNKVLDQGGTMLGDDVEIHLGVEAVKAPPPGSPVAGAKSGI